MEGDYEERRAQREHELAMIKAQQETPDSPWAETVRAVLICAIIVAGFCYLAAIGAFG